MECLLFVFEEFDIEMIRYFIFYVREIERNWGGGEKVLVMWFDVLSNEGVGYR